MKKALSVIFIALVALTISFKSIGGVFDKTFWLTFIPGLLANLAILFVAVFVIERMFRKERQQKLKEVNARRSKQVLLLSNRTAFWLLETLGLANAEEAKEDRELNFQFAVNKLKPDVFVATLLRKFKQSADRAAFIDAVKEKLNQGAETIGKALDDIFPQPDPAVRALVDELVYEGGVLAGLKMLVVSIAEANAQLGADEQFKPEHADLLIDIGFRVPAATLGKIATNIVELSKRAKENTLFVALD